LPSLETRSIANGSPGRGWKVRCARPRLSPPARMSKPPRSARLPPVNPLNSKPATLKPSRAVSRKAKSAICPRCLPCISTGEASSMPMSGNSSLFQPNDAVPPHTDHVCSAGLVVSTDAPFSDAADGDIPTVATRIAAITHANHRFMSTSEPFAKGKRSSPSDPTGIIRPKIARYRAPNRHCVTKSDNVSNETGRTELFRVSQRSARTRPCRRGATVRKRDSTRAGRHTRRGCGSAAPHRTACPARPRTGRTRSGMRPRPPVS
jgi:hypothetical protein